MRLNNEQQKLVEENHNLIYKYMIDNKLPQDDFYDIVAIGLCKAAIKYNKDSGYTFATYAYQTISNTIINDTKYEKRHIVETCSANTECIAGDDTADEFINTFESDDNVELEVSTINHFEWFIENMNNRELQIFIYHFKGLSDRAIGKIFNINNTMVSKICRDIKRQYKNNSRPNTGLYCKKDNLIKRSKLKQELLDIVREVV